MPKQSAGILLYRKAAHGLQVFLVHPGGPFFKNKDEGSWSVPKGEYPPDEDPLMAAKREFQEETGHEITGNFIALNPIKQKGGKTVLAWAVEGSIDPEEIKSNTFEIEWPPRSGKKQTFDEIDRAEWFDMATAKIKINPAQAALIDELAAITNY
ncbi:NUDIX domain-containing protein [Mucilaginibacter rubeus]|uniref:NUDIX domain-containing protein n=1 Tax=Mucilaginibacter rubeus TaxID=2027860 RepID=A0AAE6JCZ9_9SPHI|nr:MULTISPECIES: NUDIX domain-containing protein [Mucilaginibacter]QEM03281.1 NUDIX domain-containing protein [Mucilaginibacter rubeus]QEM15899.1 NUDIX domain-containing protein [Mucilaginibacter gossypii]QTE41359.1 NUDIX domain-containing protein [Mucilaginibacter rubeus]QTE47963.1 NUDIX domain-containing protein [Mucilaginibacter rubeus]QTE59356.1 NUDIX domain-containing protein [Mucilaginibacter rubeus]